MAKGVNKEIELSISVHLGGVDDDVGCGGEGEQEVADLDQDAAPERRLAQPSRRH